MEEDKIPEALNCLGYLMIICLVALSAVLVAVLALACAKMVGLYP